MTTEGLTRGRRPRGERRQISSVPEQRPFAQPRLLHGPTNLLSDDQLETIHQGSLRILRDIGMKVLDPETRGLYALLVGLAAVTVVGVALTTTLAALLGLAVLLPASRGLRTVLSGAEGPALVPVLQTTGVAELVYAAGLTVGLLLG